MLAPPWRAAGGLPGRGVVSLGFGADGKRIRRKISGKTKSVVQDRLKALHADLDTGVRASPNYTLRRAAEDWLAEGLGGRTAKTIKKNENVLTPILAVIGARRLRELTAADVHQALTTMALRYSSATMAMGHNALTRVIRHAEARDLVGRNVALRLATGIRTEEARALHWGHVDFGNPVANPPVPASAAVWRSVCAHGDTKAEKSRRTLALPEMAVTALWAHRERQASDRAAVGLAWSERDLIFSARTGAALDAANVRREFKAVCTAAKIGVPAARPGAPAGHFTWSRPWLRSWQTGPESRRRLPARPAAFRWQERPGRAHDYLISHRRTDPDSPAKPADPASEPERHTP